MPYVCATVNCTSGYKAHTTDKSVSFHRFPLKDPVLLGKWVRNMHRVDFVPTDYSRLCSLHFEKDEFQTLSKDSNRRRSKGRDSSELVQIRLSDNAVPTLFQMPSYLLREKSEERQTVSKTSSSARREVEERQNDELAEEFLETDKIRTLEDIENQIKSATIPVPFGFSITRYCLDTLGWEYVMLGQLQSDLIEKRFSWFRQLSGANYYISTRQLVQNEKKIRIHSLLKFSDFSVSELCANTLENREELVSNTAAELIDSISENLGNLPSPEQSDLQVLYYVAGALVRSEIRMRNCDKCRNLLIHNGPIADLPVFAVDGEITSDVRDLLNGINRGGLCVPSALAFAIGIKCWTIFQALQTVPSLREKFQETSDKKFLFTEIVTRQLSEDVSWKK